MAGDNSTALFHIAVIMDPLSVLGQRWSNLLEVSLAFVKNVLKANGSVGVVVGKRAGYVH